MNKKNIFLISLLALAAVVFANSATLFAEADEQKKVELRKTPNPASDFEYELNQAGSGVIITKYIGEDKEVLIPAEIEGFAVTELGDGAFAAYNVSGDVTSVVIPDSVVKMGSQVFLGCSDLQKVVLPKNLTEIPYETFSGCESLTSISWPPNLKKIGRGAFANAYFSSFVIPDSVTEMGYGVFDGNEFLRSLTLSKNMKVMPYLNEACQNLSELKNFEQLTTFPKGRYEDYSNVFLGCSKLPLAIQKKLRDLGYKGKFK